MKALAHVLHYAHGVPVRKAPAIIEDLTGIRLTQGAITQHAMALTAGEIGTRYAALRDQVRTEPVTHTDDTGWRVAGKQAFLMAFVNPSLAVYQVRDRHRNEEVRELIPGDYKGILVCDRGKSYDAEELAGLRQQKCLAHLLRNASDIGNKKKGRASDFSRKLKALLREGLALLAMKPQLDAAHYAAKANALQQELTLHLRNRSLRDDDHQRLLNGVGTQHDPGHILRFFFMMASKPPIIMRNSFCIPPSSPAKSPTAPVISSGPAPSKPLPALSRPCAELLPSQSGPRSSSSLPPSTSLLPTQIQPPPICALLLAGR